MEMKFDAMEDAERNTLARVTTRISNLLDRAGYKLAFIAVARQNDSNGTAIACTWAPEVAFAAAEQDTNPRAKRDVETLHDAVGEVVDSILDPTFYKEKLSQHEARMATLNMPASSLIN